MNQGQLQEILNSQIRTHRLLEELIAAVKQSRPVVLAVPADGNAAELMAEINAALYGEAPPPPPPKPKRKKSKPKPGDGVKVA